ncbi:TIGR01458 family HAD-type hydrolase [Methanoregula sp.]|jgi:HAD superfamily hydrolase (TIGR01458 family)|uniref:TIGR01458 family HAD-type hydrolase n=1 Tax=Methanoregula sp. TaxID=2052170 RepID=UPI003C24029F
MGVKGLLIDLDGVLYVGDKPVDGARDVIPYLIKNDIAFRVLSNTTRKCRRTIAEKLAAMGFDIPEEYIFTPPLAAIAHMKKTKLNRYYRLTTGDVDQDFNGIGLNDCSGQVDCVILGDAGDAITYDNLNRAFRQIMGGAELIALERDRYWMAHDGLALSAGPFVTALEFATGKKATVVGKPSRAFFELALRDMDLQTDQVAMVGDDIVTDVGGAQAAGIPGILVRTGKFRERDLIQGAITPWKIIDSIANLQEIL